MLSKVPTPAKENSRAWAWALQQNIMGLSFENTQLVLKHNQHDVPIYTGPIVLSVYFFRVSIKNFCKVRIRPSAQIAVRGLLDLERGFVRQPRRKLKPSDIIL